MKKNNTTNTTTTNNANNKEDKGMKKMSVFTAFRLSGYALGYSITTVRLNAKEIGRKVKESACGEAFATGYAEAEDKATERFYEKCAKKAEKKQKKADEKAAEEALNEMFESMMDDEEEEEIEESTSSNWVNPVFEQIFAQYEGFNEPVETRYVSKSMCNQDMLAYFMNKENGWHLAFDDGCIPGAQQYVRTVCDASIQRAYVFQNAKDAAKYIPAGYCTKLVLKGTNTIVGLEYPEYGDGTVIDLFDNGFIVSTRIHDEN